MKTLKFLPLLLCTFFSLLTSCSKDDRFTPSEDPMLPSKISYVWQHPSEDTGQVSSYTLSLQYDSQNRLSTIKLDYIAVGESSERTENYNLTYEGNNISMVVTRPSEPEYNNTMEFVRQESEIIRNDNEESKISIDGNLRATDYTYDKNGNILNYDGTPKYDNKIGIFRHVNMPSWFMTHIFVENYLSKRNLYNNCVELNSDSKTEVIDYVYDLNNYAIRMTVTTTKKDQSPDNIRKDIGRYTVEYVNAN